MGQGGGADLVVWFRMASAWGTTVDVDSGTGFPVIPLTWKVTPTSASKPDKAYNASRVARVSGRRGLRKVTVDLSFALKTHGITPLLACALGTAGAPTSLGGGIYRHRLYPNIDMTGKFMSAAWFDNVTYQEIDSLRWEETEIKAAPGEDVIVTMKGEGRAYIDPAVTNTTLATPTEPSPVYIVQYGDSTAINYQIVPRASSLAALEIQGWSLKWMNSFSDESSSTQVPYRRQTKAGEFMCSGTFDEPYESTVRRTAALDGAPYKASLEHAVIAGEHEVNIVIPSMNLSVAQADIASRGGMPLAVTWEHELPDSAPSETAMRPFYIEILNNSSADPLATS